MLIKINRKTAIETYTWLPLRHYDKAEERYVFSYPEPFANYVLTLTSKSYKGHVKILASELLKLMSSLGYDHFIFLGDEDIPWLRRLNTYEDFQESLQYLVDSKIGKRFNGALKVDGSELPILIKNLVWLIRTNGVLPIRQSAYFNQR